MPSRPATSPVELERRRKRPSQVRALMIGLPAVAGVLVAANVVEVIYRRATSSTTDAVVSGAAPEPRMISPRFSGSSRDGRSYQISGQEGVRDKASQHRILIVKPVLVLKGQNGEVTQMSALDGTFDEGDHTLRLKGDVRVTKGTDRTLTTQEALVDTRSGKVSGSSALEATNATGQVRSSAYEVYDKGERLVFKGGVSGRIENKK